MEKTILFTTADGAPSSTPAAFADVVSSDEYGNQTDEFGITVDENGSFDMPEDLATDYITVSSIQIMGQLQTFSYNDLLSSGQYILVRPSNQTLNTIVIDSGAGGGTQPVAQQNNQVPYSYYQNAPSSANTSDNGWIWALAIIGGLLLIGGTSHAVRRRRRAPVTGIGKVKKRRKAIFGSNNNYMKEYRATYESNGEIISEAVFEADSLKEAKELAQMHKSLTPEIKKYSKVKTWVRKRRDK